ncbi:MAG: hypothetical protein AB1733_09235 [Thermodesulfobacteriota bacterium]
MRTLWNVRDDEREAGGGSETFIRLQNVSLFSRSYAAELEAFAVVERIDNRS